MKALPCGPRERQRTASPSGEEQQLLERPAQRRLLLLGPAVRDHVRAPLGAQPDAGPPLSDAPQPILGYIPAEVHPHLLQVVSVGGHALQAAVRDAHAVLQVEAAQPPAAPQRRGHVLVCDVSTAGQREREQVGTPEDKDTSKRRVLHTHTHVWGGRTITKTCSVSSSLIPPRDVSYSARGLVSSTKDYVLSKHSAFGVRVRVCGLISALTNSRFLERDQIRSGELTHQERHVNEMQTTPRATRSGLKIERVFFFNTSSQISPLYTPSHRALVFPSSTKLLWITEVWCYRAEQSQDVWWIIAWQKMPRFWGHFLWNVDVNCCLLGCGRWSRQPGRQADTLAVDWGCHSRSLMPIT